MNGSTARQDERRKHIWLSHQPADLIHGSTNIEIWFSDEKLADDYEGGAYDEPRIVTQLGRCELGFINVVTPLRTVEIWPDYIGHIYFAAKQTVISPVELPWSVQGTVTDTAGKPVTGATVRAHCGIGSLFETGSAVTGPDGWYQFSFGPGIWSDNESLVQAATISVHLDGHFEKNLHRQGDLLAALKLPADGKIGWGDKTADDVFLPGKTKTIDFVMLPAAKISGVVTAKDGGQLDFVRVSLVGEDLPPSSNVVANTRTDEQGQFELTEIPTGFNIRFWLSRPRLNRPGWLGPARVQPWFFHKATTPTHTSIIRLTENRSTSVSNGYSWFSRAQAKTGRPPSQKPHSKN